MNTKCNDKQNYTYLQYERYLPSMDILYTEI